MRQVSETYYKWDFWSKENLNYVQPHFRLQKAARLVNRIAQGKECDLLDVGCGPATLMRLLQKNIHYYGIDIAIHEPAPYLLQADFLETPIKFGGRKFDIIVAQGVFEYIGSFESQKFSEIAQLLNEDGTFIVSYVNFGHRNKCVYWPYSNIQPLEDFQKSLASFFHVDRFFPTSHRWHHAEPTKRLMMAVQMHININVPFVSRSLAVEYFFICSPRSAKRTGTEYN